MANEETPMSRPPGITCFHSNSPQSPGTRTGSTLNSPPGVCRPGRKYKVELTFSLAWSPQLPESFPSILSLVTPALSPPGTYQLRARDAGGAGPGPSRCRLPPASLRHGAATRRELAAASSLRCGWAEPVAARCGAEGAARSRPRELS